MDLFGGFLLVIVSIFKNIIPVTIWIYLYKWTEGNGRESVAVFESIKKNGRIIAFLPFCWLPSFY